MRRLNRLLRFSVIALIVGAIVQQLQRPAPRRDWTGHVLGIPYDFRMPTLRRLEQTWWNPNDPHLLTARAFGLGWGVNLYQIKKRIESLLG